MQLFSDNIKQIIQRVFYFFPFQLVFLHLKHNLLVLTIWGVLLGFVTEIMAVKYGIPYLFLSPEYLGEVNAWSFGIIGFAAGGFVMAFNIYSYIMHGFKFPFLATVSRPFYKFCVNNSIIPITFFGIYMWKIARFQALEELSSTIDIVKYEIAFISGLLFFFFFSILYFVITNKNIEKLSGKT